MLAILTIFSMW